MTIFPTVALGGLIVVWFFDERGQMLWNFFNMLSLALLTVFEGAALSLLLVRLAKVIQHKKRRGLVYGTGATHHFRGIILINLGMMLSLGETLMGFFPQSFVLAITRRAVKSAGRILIILGLLKG